jgi:hypothetical protein
MRKRTRQRRRTRTQEDAGLPLRGSATFLLAFAGAFAGAAIIFGDYGNWGDDNQAFAGSGPFILWLGLICAQTAVWAVGIWVLVEIQKGLGHRGQWRIWGSATAMFAVALGGALVGTIVPDVLGWESFSYLHGRPWKISLLSLFGCLVAVYGLVGMWRIYYELRPKRDESVSLAYLPTYLKLHDKLQQLITVVGGALGLVVLAAAAERNAAQAFEKKICPQPDLLHRLLPALGGGGCDAHFPYEFVLVYGFYFTALLGFAYVPVGLALQDVGRKMRASSAPVDDVLGENPDVPGWKAKREALTDILDLDVGTATSFRTAIAILTPVIGSLTGLLFTR